MKWEKVRRSINLIEVYIGSVRRTLQASVLWLAVGLLWVPPGLEGQEGIVSGVTPNLVYPGGRITVRGDFGSGPENYTLWIEGNDTVVPVEVLHVAPDQLTCKVGYAAGPLEGVLKVAAGSYVSFLDETVFIDGHECRSSGAVYSHGLLCDSMDIALTQQAANGKLPEVPDSLVRALNRTDPAMPTPEKDLIFVNGDFVFRSGASQPFISHDDNTDTVKTCKVVLEYYGVSPLPTPSGCTILEKYILETDCCPWSGGLDIVAVLAAELDRNFGNLGLSVQAERSVLLVSTERDVVSWFMVLMEEP